MSGNHRTRRASVIIPSLNSPLIDQVVAAVKGQALAEQIVEIVVVGKDEGGHLQVGTGVRLIDTDLPVPPGTARNIGIGSTEGDLLLFVDSDCVAQPGWLAEHLKAHNSGHPVVGGGVVPSGDSFWALSYNLGMFHDYLNTGEPGPRDFLPTLNLSVERRVIERVGYLDESLPRSQDMDWTARMKRAGFQPFFWPAAAIEHRHNRATLRAVWQDNARTGHNARQVRLHHRDLLATPSWLRSRSLTLVLSPFIAAWVTGGIIWRQPGVMMRSWQTWPAIYLSKIAWCWGASRPSQSP